MGASCFAFSSLLTLSAWRQRTSWLAGYFQLSAVLVQTFALAIFPMGFHSSFARGMCGPNTSMYNMDRCHIGWGYVLAIVTTSLVVFCPFLSKFSTNTTKRGCTMPTSHDFGGSPAAGCVTSSSQPSMPVTISSEHV